MILRLNDLDSTVKYLYSLSDSEYAKIVVPKSYSGEYDYSIDIDNVLKLSRVELLDVLEYTTPIDINIDGCINEIDIIISIYENW